MTSQLAAPTRVVATRTTNRKPGPVSYLWLVWRQHGGMLVTAVVVTLGLCGTLLYTGRMLSSLHCTPYPRVFVGAYSPGGCSAVASWNLHLYETARWSLRAVVALPALLGVFWGAPLVSREHETGTYGLAWGQGVTARQWLRGKLLVLGALSSLLCLATWLCARPVAESLSRLEYVGRFGWEAFDTLAPLTVGYALAALALGVLCSVVTRTTVPALVLAAVVCLGLGVGTADVLRPHYLPATVAHYPAAEDSPPFSQTALYLTYNGWADAAGQPTDFFPRQCLQPTDPCLREHGISGRISVYQPASREAELQLIEAGLALLVAAGCVVLAVAFVGRGFGAAR